MTTLQIRKRERFQASPPAGLSQAWIEWQVLDGRRVVARESSEASAIRALEAYKLDMELSENTAR